MDPVRFSIRSGFLALALVGAWSACDLERWIGGEPAESGRRGLGNRDPHTLIVGRPTDAISLDPARPTDTESVEVVNQLYDTLLRYRPGSNTPEPGLATHWETADRGQVWTFHLREGVYFHDGTPLNAEAVVFSFERQRDPRHPYHRDDFSYWENVYRNIEKVEQVDELTVRITIERSFAPFTANLTMFPVAIVSPTAMKQSGDSFDDHPVGTGPFRFVSWTKGDSIVLERNEDYWDGAPLMRRLVFHVIPDPKQRLIALESGRIDLAHAIQPEELQFVRLHPNLRLHQVPGNNVAYLAINTTHPPFDDVRVRRAANYAVNKKPIVKMLYQGLAVVADGPLPPTQWGYHPVEVRYTYDRARARQLLQEAQESGRFDPGSIHTLYVPSTPRPYLPNPELIGRVIQTNLAEVGIKTTIEVRDFENHLAAVQKGDHDLCLLGWVGDNGDPDNFLHTLFDRANTVPGLARNVAFFRDPQLHGLLVMAQESDDRAEREHLYRRVQDLIASEAPWIPLAHSQVAIASRDDVGGIVTTLMSQIHYRAVRRIVR